MTVIHSFEPVCRPDAKALVLGSMPGQLSLTRAEYYAHPRNAFWPIMGALFGAVPQLDPSIIANDFAAFYALHPQLRFVFFNGAKAEAAYKKHVLPALSSASASLHYVRLPSTSPAHAGKTQRQKLEQWQIIKEVV